ncbi:hypothetical protein GCM10022377_22830 [Zhihengliuella alba]|uniref:Uncharacterized protein n=1 Tax=Zhihengliuella alba TaxID=547018 RepID=A0ABP7DQE3_9MICC
MPREHHVDSHPQSEEANEPNTEPFAQHAGQSLSSDQLAAARRLAQRILAAEASRP